MTHTSNRIRRYLYRIKPAMIQKYEGDIPDFYLILVLAIYAGATYK